MIRFISVGAVLTSIACAAKLSLVLLPGATMADETEYIRGNRESHDAHGEEENIVHLNAEKLKEFGVQVAKAGPGRLQMLVELPGEIMIDPDRLARIVPRVAGSVMWRTGISAALSRKPREKSRRASNCRRDI